MSSNKQGVQTLVEISLPGAGPWSHTSLSLSKNAPDSSKEVTLPTEAADLKLQPLFYLTATFGIYGLWNYKFPLRPGGNMDIPVME